MIYRALTERLDEDGRLRVDAILGDRAAQVEVDKRRHGSAVDAGFEVG